MKIKYFYLAIAIFFSCLTYAQSDSKTDKRDDNKNDSIEGGSRSNPVELPQLVPASLKASSITKYGDYPDTHIHVHIQK